VRQPVPLEASAASALAAVATVGTVAEQLAVAQQAARASFAHLGSCLATEQAGACSSEFAVAGAAVGTVAWGCMTVGHWLQLQRWSCQQLQ